MSLKPKQKRRPLGKGDGAANQCLQLGGSGQFQPYSKAGRRATILREIRDEQGRFQGLEAVAYG